MTTPVLLFAFSADEPFTLDKLNVNFQALVSVVNALAAEQVAQFGPASVSAQYLGIAGGTLLGQLAAPSILVGPDGGTKYPVVTTEDAGTVYPALTESGALRDPLEGPAISVGPEGGTKYPVVTTNDAATATTRGAVKQGLVVPVLTLIPSMTYDPNQLLAVASKVDALIISLREAGVLAAS